MLRGALMVAAFACAAGKALAATAIYKCTKPDGSVVFAPTSCGSNAKTIVAPSPPLSAGMEGAPPAVVPQDAAIRAIHDSVEDSHCRDDAHALYREPDHSALNQAQAEIGALEKRIWAGRNAAAVQILAGQDQTRIAALRGIVATEQARIDAGRTESRRIVAEAIAKCDRIKAERSVSVP